MCLFNVGQDTPSGMDRHSNEIPLHCVKLQIFDLISGKKINDGLCNEANRGAFFKIMTWKKRTWQSMLKPSAFRKTHLEE